ncbi:MAG: CDP-diacylglycerol--glycerol-3-phosphate 3-phosphatidyltransferase [Usitatibacter sp.]
MAVRFNFPLFLTWCRIVAIPLFVAVLYLPEDWLSAANKNLIAMWIFIIAAVTDWLDGWLARRWNQTTSFGAFLDPVADKLMVAAALIVLTHKDLVDPFASLIIIGREITISALREWMAHIGKSKSVAVNILGKFKTVAQLVAIPFLLYNGFLFGLLDTNWAGRWLIWAAAMITLWSMVVYLKAAWASGALHEK